MKTNDEYLSLTKAWYKIDKKVIDKNNQSKPLLLSMWKNWVYFKSIISKRILYSKPKKCLMKTMY